MSRTCLTLASHNFNTQISGCEEEVDRLTASKAAAQAEAEEADAAAQQALETGHAEVSEGEGQGGEQWSKRVEERKRAGVRAVACAVSLAHVCFSSINNAMQHKPAPPDTCYYLPSLPATTNQVMKLRRRYDELSAEVSGLSQQREMMLTQMAEQQAEWEKQQQVGGDSRWS